MANGIRIEKLTVPCHIGVTAAERRKAQPIRLSIVLTVDHSRAQHSDNIEDTVNYASVRKTVIDVVNRSRFHLLEALANAIGDRCLLYPRAQSVRVVAQKPKLYADTDSVGVEYVKARSFVRTLKPHPTLLCLPPIAVMGVLNVTPDSFSDGGLYYDTKKAIAHALEMERQGASIIDVGGESTRPGASFVHAQEELQRVLPVIRALRTKLKKTTLISVDTWKSLVAHKALAAGASIINSLNGLTFDPLLVNVIDRTRAPIIMYHTYGKPKTIRAKVHAKRNVIDDLLVFFRKQIIIGADTGIQPNQYILDPGIGFGKTVEQNIEIIRRLNELIVFGLPIAVSCSRKGHLGSILQRAFHLKDIPPPNERIEAGLAETAIAVSNGATIIRAHDVAETKKFVTVLNALRMDQ